MNELQKLDKKISIYNRGDFMLSADSLTGEVLNVDFSAIDGGLYERLQQRQKTDYSGRAINALMNGQKISIGTI